MDPLTAEHLVAIAKAILDAVDYCFLITQGEAGDASARLMQHFKPEGDLTLWFGTSAASRTVRELGSTPRATVTCLDQMRPAYAVLGGVVTIEERARQWWRYWREAWQTVWPEGPRGPDYLLLRLACERVEVLNVEAGVPPPPYGWRAGGWSGAEAGGSWSAGSRAGRRVCTPPGRRTTWRSKIGLVWTAAPTG